MKVLVAINMVFLTLASQITYPLSTTSQIKGLNLERGAKKATQQAILRDITDSYNKHLEEIEGLKMDELNDLKQYPLSTPLFLLSVYCRSQ